MAIRCGREGPSSGLINPSSSECSFRLRGKGEKKTRSETTNGGGSNYRGREEKTVLIKLRTCPNGEKDVAGRGLLDKLGLRAKH